jgi:hypothetical protein
MTTFTLTHPRATAVIAASDSIAKRSPPFLLSDWLDVLAKSLAMVRAVPDSGRITAQHMEKVRAISATI